MSVDLIPLLLQKMSILAVVNSMVGDGTELPITHIGKTDFAYSGTFSKPLALIPC